MPKQKIHNWLNGNRNFNIGRAIYKIYGNKQTLKDILAKGYSQMGEKLLVFEMQELIAEPSEKKVVLPVEKKSKKVAIKQTEIISNDNPAAVMADSDDHVLQAIKIEWHKPYKQMCYLITQLDKYGDSNTKEAINERKQLAANILELEQICMQSWAKRDYYIEHGFVQGAKNQELEIPTDPLALAALINSIKRNIRNNRASMTKKPNQPVYAKKYLMYKDQYKQITGKNYQEVENGE
jgi:hypothetical protein